MRAFFTILAVLTGVAWTMPLRASPFEDLPDGRMRHSDSGFLFPKRIGFFERAGTRQFNEAGTDVAVGYNAGVLIAATVYVYPAPKKEGTEVLAREYAGKRFEVIHGHDAVTVLSEDRMTVVQGAHKHEGQRAYFSFHDKFAGTPQSLKSQLLVFRDGPQFVEYRFTYPRDHAEEAEKEIDRFIHAWTWRPAD